MSDREPQRTWTQAQIGTVERADPRSRWPGDTGNPPPGRLIEAAILFKNQTTIGTTENRAVMRRGPEEQEDFARKALWRYIHQGLDGPLFEVLDDVRRASACVSPVDPAQTFLREAAARIQKLIDHVLGNERPTDHDSFIGPKPLPELSRPVNPQTRENPNGLHGTVPGPRVAD